MGPQPEFTLSLDGGIPLDPSVFFVLGTSRTPFEEARFFGGDLLPVRPLLSFAGFFFWAGSPLSGFSLSDDGFPVVFPSPRR